MNKTKFNNKNLWIGLGVIVVIVILLIIFLPGKAPEELDESTAEEEPTALVETEEVEQVEEPVVDKIDYSASELCEDYVMKQGETLDLDDNKIKLIKIGQVSVRASINGQEVILPAGEDVYEKGIRVELKSNDLIFFDEDDEENRVEFRIGCKSSDDPTEKHILKSIQTRGESICRAIIRECESKFDI